MFIIIISGLKKTKETKKPMENIHLTAISPSNDSFKVDKNSSNNNPTIKEKTKGNMVKTGESTLEITSTANKVTISKTEKKLIDFTTNTQAASGLQSMPSTFSSSLTITPVDGHESTSKPLPTVPNKVKKY